MGKKWPFFKNIVNSFRVSLYLSFKALTFAQVQPSCEDESAQTHGKQLKSFNHHIYRQHMQKNSRYKQYSLYINEFTVMVKFSRGWRDVCGWVMLRMRHKPTPIVRRTLRSERANKEVTKVRFCKCEWLFQFNDLQTSASVVWVHNSSNQAATMKSTLKWQRLQFLEWPLEAGSKGEPISQWICMLKLNKLK